MAAADGIATAGVSAAVIAAEAAAEAVKADTGRAATVKERPGKVAIGKAVTVRRRRVTGPLVVRLPAKELPARPLREKAEATIGTTPTGMSSTRTGT